MKKNVKNLNFLLLFFMIAYSAFGLLMILSASSVAAVLRYKVSTNYFFLRQLVFLLGGYILGLIIINVPTKNYRYFSKILMYGMIPLLGLVLFFGKIAGGAKGWYKVGSINIQPLEFMKVILIIYMAVYYNKIANKKKINLLTLLWPLILAIIIFVLVAMQPDLGGACIIAFITALIFFSIPFGKKYKKGIVKFGLIILALGGLGMGLFGKSLMQSYQASRFNFLKPCSRYGEDSGYQVCNGYIAIHNGGLSGVGLGNSTQKYLYLPEAHTDFIFAIICEELGLIFGIIIIAGYFIMLFIILNIAKETDNLRNSILAYGIFAYLLAHILVNLLGILGLVPLTGVPLPFLSYGGSYCLNVIIALFIVQRINIENKQAKQRKKIENL